MKPITAKEMKRLAESEAFQQVVREMVQRRDQFIQSMIVLGRDSANPHSQSYWSRLPKDLMLYIIGFIDFQPHESIGKDKKQIYQCAAFIFTHITELNECLIESINNQQRFKVLEKRSNGNSQFRFFSSKAEEKNKPENEKNYSENNNCLVM